MQDITLDVVVAEDRTVTLQLPPEVSPGVHRVTLHVVDDLGEPRRRPPLRLPVIHIPSWPEDNTLRREDIYGDDGR